MSIVISGIVFLLSIIGIFCSSFLLITTEHKKKFLPFFSVMSYVMFLIVYLLVECIIFLKLFSDDMFLMAIVATACFVTSIVISYKIKEDEIGEKLKKVIQTLFWCCILFVITLINF